MGRISFTNISDFRNCRGFYRENGVNASSSKITKHTTDVKLPLLQLPNFSGNVLELPAFYDAFVASVDSHKKLSNVQTFSRPWSCLSGRAIKCIEDYSVTNNNFDLESLTRFVKSFWTGAFVRKRACQAHFKSGYS